MAALAGGDLSIRSGGESNDCFANADADGADRRGDLATPCRAAFVDCRAALRQSQQ
jgi:hypothetical protein